MEDKLNSKTLGNFVLLIVILQVLLHIASGRSNTSAEHSIRKLLLDDYDQAVLPIRGGSPVDVEFGLKLNALQKVDSKEQLISVDTWVVMKWNNTFLYWDKSKYGGKDRVNFLPTEVWFPDIALHNNGDNLTPRAGGTSKFLSNVAVDSDGLNVWSGPASFTASCELKLDYWPFDTQKCAFRFGSFSYHKQQLTISPFATKSTLGESFIENGDWAIMGIDIDIGETDHGNCCPYKFSQISFTITMERKYSYQMFYVVAPCLIMSILTLVSFWIPSESGERIGFVTTLLLGMMVFLLIVPDSLPESSRAIPVLGVLLMCTLVLISFVLLATIAVLRCFHTEGTPPKYLRWLSKSTVVNDNGAFEIVELDRQKPSVATLRAVQPFQADPAVKPGTPRTKGTATVSWQGIACRLDTIFFWFFLVVYVVVYAVLLTARG
ncbi:neuronal acetylcholine receptor subunit beta-3-like [Actinia tenebrosa]|uniref:Neuronal acetylcholine receptor subunit beta-3-like n=1 Tax=Actinia tenebrosa TaxID=6105 RepID=A0A6P8IWX6_ACTTE|nr:neuronal acetylcholine receptor subunit beta-3-like [Actinia tenebrosa]